MVFRHLAVENFRGFQRRQEFDIAASVILLRGPNGVGKTSFFDALQWLLVGDIPRLRDARLRKTEEHILNAYATSDTATVSATIETHDGVVEISRNGNRSGSSLTWHRVADTPLMNRAAEASLGAAFGATEEVTLETALTAAGLLQQDAARLVLQSPPKERFTLFAQLLGLARLEKFESWADQRARVIAAETRSLQDGESALRSRLTQGEQRLAQLRGAEEERPSIVEARQRLEPFLNRLSIEAIVDLDRDRAALVAASAARLAQECQDLARLQASLSPEPPTSTDEQMQDVALRADSARELLQVQRQAILDNEASLRELQSAQADVQRLVDAATPLATGDHCPLCQQAITQAELRRRIIRLGEPNPAALEATQSIQRMRESMAAIEVQLARLEEERREVADRQQQQRAEAARRSEYSSRLKGLQTHPEGIRVLDHVKQGGQPELTELANRMQQLAGLARELVFAFDAAQSTESASLEAELSQMREQLGARSKQLGFDSARTANAKQLATAAAEARLDIVRERLEQLRPIAQDIYSRMDPHPTFTELELVSEMFRSAGTTTAQVRDERASISADPMLVFSSAQANVTAIAYLIALNWAAAGRIPMLLLDDPLQAMDDINVLGFADLCRHLRSDRQVIVSTHERRFADLLERKLSPRREGERSVVLEFTGWDRTGPDVKIRELPDQVDAGEARVGLRQDRAPEPPDLH